MRRVLVIAAAIMLFPMAAMAQDATPVTTPASTDGTSTDYDAITDASGMPRANVFGAGWELDYAEDNGTEAGARYRIWYTHSGGDRIYVAVYPFGDSVSDAVEAYGLSSDHVAAMESELIEGDEGRTASELAELNAPLGCSDVTWAEGFDRFTFYPTAAIACLDEANDRVLTVVLSGVVEGEDGSEAPYVPGLNVVMQHVFDVSPVAIPGQADSTPTA